MSGENLWREKLEILDGSRRTTVAHLAAVRVQDLEAVLQIRMKLRSAKAAGPTPTKAEFDALFDDVRDIHTILVALQATLQKRVLP